MAVPYVYNLAEGKDSLSNHKVATQDDQKWGTSAGWNPLAIKSTSQCPLL